MNFIVLTLGLLFSPFALASVEAGASSNIWIKEFLFGYNLVEIIKFVAALSILIGVLSTIKGFRQFIIFIYLKFELQIQSLKRIFINLFKSPIFNPIKKAGQKIFDFGIYITRIIRAIPVKYHLMLLLAVTLTLTFMTPAIKSLILQIPYVSERALTFFNVIVTFSNLIVMGAILFSHFKELSERFNEYSELKQIPKEKIAKESFINRIFLSKDNEYDILCTLIAFMATFMAVVIGVKNQEVQSNLYFLITCIFIVIAISARFAEITKLHSIVFTLPLLPVAISLLFPKKLAEMNFSSFSEPNFWIVASTMVGFYLFYLLLYWILEDFFKIYSAKITAYVTRKLTENNHDKSKVINKDEINRAVFKFEKLIHKILILACAAFYFYAWTETKGYMDGIKYWLIFAVPFCMTVNALPQILQGFFDFIETIFIKFQTIKIAITYIFNKALFVFSKIANLVMSWKTSIFTFAILSFIYTQNNNQLVVEYTNTAYQFLFKALPTDENLQMINLLIFGLLAFNSITVGYYLNLKYAKKATKPENADEEAIIDTVTLSLGQKIKCYIASKEHYYSYPLFVLAAMSGYKYFAEPHINHFVLTLITLGISLFFFTSLDNIYDDISKGGERIGIKNKAITYKPNRFIQTLPRFLAFNIASLVGYAIYYNSIENVTYEAGLLVALVLMFNCFFIFDLLFNANTTIKRTLVPFISLMLLLLIPVVDFILGNYHMLSVASMIAFTPVLFMLCLFSLHKKHKGLRLFAIGIFLYTCAYGLESININNLENSPDGLIKNIYEQSIKENAFFKNPQK